MSSNLSSNLSSSLSYLVGALLGFLFLIAVQTVISALCLWVTFDWILPLADGFWAPGGSIREYLVYGLATVPLKIIFTSTSTK